MKVVYLKLNNKKKNKKILFVFDNCDQIDENFKHKLVELSSKLNHAKIILITLNTYKLGINQKNVRISPLSEKDAAKLLIFHCGKLLPFSMLNVENFSENKIFTQFQRTPRNILIIAQLMEKFNNINVSVKKFLETQDSNTSLQSFHIKTIIE